MPGGVSPARARLRQPRCPTWCIASSACHAAACMSARVSPIPGCASNIVDLGAPVRRLCADGCVGLGLLRGAQTPDGRIGLVLGLLTAWCRVAPGVADAVLAPPVASAQGAGCRAHVPPRPPARLPFGVRSRWPDRLDPTGQAAVPPARCQRRGISRRRARRRSRCSRRLVAFTPGHDGGGGLPRQVLPDADGLLGSAIGRINSANDI